MKKRNPKLNPQPGDLFQDKEMIRFVSVVLPVSLVGHSAVVSPAVFIRDIASQKPALRCVELANFKALVRSLEMSITNSLHADEKSIEPMRLPKAHALQILKSGRLPAELANAPGEFAEPIPYWLASCRSDLRLYAAELVAKRPRPEDVTALRKLVVRSGWMNDHAAKLGCKALGRLKAKASEAIPELVRAARAFVSGGCPQRFCDSTAAILKITETPPAELVDICASNLKSSNFGILKSAVEALLAIATPAAHRALRSMPVRSGTGPFRKPLEELRLRVRAVVPD